MKQVIKPNLKFDKVTDLHYLCYSKDHIYNVKKCIDGTFECDCYYGINFLSTGIKKTYCKHINGLIELLAKENSEI